MKILNIMMISILVFFTLFLGAKAVEWELEQPERNQDALIMNG